MHGRASFCYADKNVLKSGILSYIFIKVMHEFTSRLSCGELKNRSKTVELLCKNIQTYWQSPHRGWLVVDVNFTQNKARIF